MNKEEKNKLAEENLGLVYLVVNKEFTYEKTTESDRENYLGSGSNRIAEKESFNFKSIEVIGNVFENEELLEVKSYERD